MKKEHVLIALCVLAFLAVNALTLQNGHNWGGDFSHYIRHALNILEGKPYNSSVMLDHWGATPPVFPLLLTPVLAAAGLNFQFLKIPNLLYWLATCLILFIACRKRSDCETSQLLFLCLLSSPFFFFFKQNILSDLPFVLFYSAAILLLDKRTEKHQGAPLSSGLFWGLFFLAMTLLTRLAGVALCGAALVYALFVRRDTKMFLGLLFSMLISLVILYAFGVSFGDPMTAFPRSPSAILIQAFMNIAYVTGLFLNFFMPIRTPLNAFLLDHGLPFLKILAPFACITVFFIGAVRLFRRNISLPFLAFLAYSALILMWPALESRYVLPLAPWLLVLILRGVEHHCCFLSQQNKKRRAKIWQRWTKGVLAVLILHNCWSIALGYHMNDDDIRQPVNQELFEWVKLNTHESDRMMFHYPRVLWLLTGRPSTPFFSAPQDRPFLTERMIKHRINYMILMPHGRNLHLLSEIDPARVQCGKVWENQQFMIFKVESIGAKSVE